MKLSNYADGLYINLKEDNNIPSGIKIRLYIGNKYDDVDKVNIYSYDQNSNKLELTQNDVTIEKGYIEFNTTKTKDYLLTMSNIPNIKEESNSKESYSSKYLLLWIIIFILVIAIGATLMLKRKRPKL